MYGWMFVLSGLKTLLETGESLSSCTTAGAPSSTPAETVRFGLVLDGSDGSGIGELEAEGDEHATAPSRMDPAITLGLGHEETAKMLGGFGRPRALAGSIANGGVQVSKRQSGRMFDCRRPHET
jgi:hypothetical protein